MYNNFSGRLNGIRSALRNSLTLKILLIGFVLLVLLIPLAMTSGLRSERGARAVAVEGEVSFKWGGAQAVTAPVLVLTLERTVTSKNGAAVVEQQNLMVLPEVLRISGKLTPEVRYRGIYQARLYSSQLKFTGVFVIPPPPENWRFGRRSTLEWMISDIKGICKLDVDFDGRRPRLVPGSELGSGVHCVLADGPLEVGRKIDFSGELDVNGCRQLTFQPIGRDFSLELTSSWPHPSFTGGFLPVSREVTSSGFVARWQTNEMNRGYPQSWRGCRYKFDSGNALGVELVQPVNSYGQVKRVADYAVLLIAIVLVAFLVGESVTGVWVHPLQYFFIGLSLVLFYMLLLALCEHFGFGVSYAVTAAVIVGMTTGYGTLIFAEKRVAALILGGVMALAYLLIYALIRMEDYALLTGSLILLVLLAMLMKFTGRINRGNTAPPAAPGGTIPPTC